MPVSSRAGMLKMARHDAGKAPRYEPSWYSHGRCMLWKGAKTVMFNQARLRLTAWYLAVLAVIVILLSYALYDLLVRLQQAEVEAITPIARHGVVRLFARDQGVLALQIIAI